MNKTLVSIIVISLIIISTTLQINALEINREKSGTSTPEHLKNYENGNVETDYIDENPLVSNEGGPDLIVLGLAACWGYDFYDNCDALYVKWYVSNIGENYVQDGTIYCDIALFADNEPSPFYVFTVTPISDTGWTHWESIGRNWNFDLNIRPDTITVKADYTNVIPESNESNNAESYDVVSAINVSGYVYDKKANGDLTPIAGCWILPGQGLPINGQGDRSVTTRSSGEYHTILYPADQPHTYSLVAEAPVSSWQLKLKIKKWQINTTRELSSGDDLRVDFIFEGRQPSKPFIPIGKRIGITGKSYTFRTTALDLYGDEIYYLFDWADGTYSYWLGPYKSGDIVEASHIFTRADPIYIHEIRVLVKDSHGTLSGRFSFSALITIFNTGGS